MARTTRIKVTMLFPIFDNDGNAFDEETVDWWRDALHETLGGAYNEPGQTLGHWEGYTELCRWIVAVVDERDLDKIYAFLAEARRRFRQDVMYLDYHPVTFDLIS